MKACERVEVIGINGQFAYTYEDGRIRILSPRSFVYRRAKKGPLIILITFVVGVALAAAIGYGLLDAAFRRMGWN